jgi:small subunit ribosomal protein S5
VIECAGIGDILTKSLGSENAINMVHATVAGLKALRRPEDVASIRGRPIEEIAPRRLVEALRKTEAEGAPPAGQDPEKEAGTA